MKNKTFFVLTLILFAIILTGCEVIDNPTLDTKQDVTNTLNVGDKLTSNQPTPTDIDYSLERYNLIKRAYWVNGMRDKARTLPSPIADMPLGYIVLLTNSGSVVGKFIVDGKVTSLNSYLTPSTDYEKRYYYTLGSNIYSIEIPDVDGSYGSNDNGIFFFTTDGKYIEWTGTYLYSDIPFIVDEPILKVGE